MNTDGMLYSYLDWQARCQITLTILQRETKAVLETNESDVSDLLEQERNLDENILRTHRALDRAIEKLNRMASSTRDTAIPTDACVMRCIPWSTMRADVLSIEHALREKQVLDEVNERCQLEERFHMVWCAIAEMEEGRLMHHINLAKEFLRQIEFTTCAVQKSVA